MRIGVAHSSPEVARMLCEFIKSRPGYEISWVASSGVEAIEKSASVAPDLLLMDLNLSGVAGDRATRTIMKRHPCAILIITPAANEKAAEVFEAMGDGALDVVSLPDLGEKGGAKGKAELLRKITVIEKLVRKEEGPAHGPGEESEYPSDAVQPLVVIGSSTGGPKALAEVLSGLPARIGASIVIVQHLDVQFARGLVEWLDLQTSLRVVLADPDARPEQGIVYVAGTNDHLILGPDRAFHYVAEPRDYPYRPSVDRFFVSARDNWPRKGVAALLTGMGRDGAKGLLALREAGWHTIAQDEASSVVFGMPKAAAERGGAIDILSVSEIAGVITAKVRMMKEGKGIHSHEG